MLHYHILKKQKEVVILLGGFIFLSAFAFNCFVTSLWIGELVTVCRIYPNHIIEKDTKLKTPISATILEYCYKHGVEYWQYWIRFEIPRKDLQQLLKSSTIAQPLLSSKVNFNGEQYFNERGWNTQQIVSYLVGQKFGATDQYLMVDTTNAEIYVVYFFMNEWTGW